MLHSKTLHRPNRRLTCQFCAYVGLHFGVQGNGVVSDLPPLGTALPIIITIPSHADGPPKGPLVLPSVGSWVKLRNVKSWVVAGQLQVSKFFYCHPCGSIVWAHAKGVVLLWESL